MNRRLKIPWTRIVVPRGQKPKGRIVDGRLCVNAAAVAAKPKLILNHWKHK